MQSNTSSQAPREEPTASVRTNITIAKPLLTLVDEAAQKEYTTRSDIIRTALLWYLRPQGRELERLDPEEIYKLLRQRHLKAGIKKMLKDNEKDA